MAAADTPAPTAFEPCDIVHLRAAARHAGELFRMSDSITAADSARENSGWHGQLVCPRKAHTGRRAARATESNRTKKPGAVAPGSRITPARVSRSLHVLDRGV